jgi:hypothetical protein
MPKPTLITQTLIASIYLSISISHVNSKCVYYQPSITDRPLRADTEQQQTPQLYTEEEYENDMVCPDFKGKMVCCNQAARTLMSTNFLKLAFIVECQNCRNNILRMM